MRKANLKRKRGLLQLLLPVIATATFVSRGA